ncbi:MAG: glutathione peroxidase [Lachnospiraceae bacterium]
MSIYNFKVNDAKGQEVDLKDYEGKVVLIVNTATECGFTPQYADLQSLYAKYKDSGLEILDFPCNQFGHQAPGTNEEIARFCSSRFGVTFPQFEKIDVNGDKAIPLYKYLEGEKGFAGFDPEHPLTKVLEDMFATSAPNYKNEPDIKWNFTKFLVDKNGNVVQRFEPTEKISVVEEKIKGLL